jgi:hypothetical protein
MNETDNYIGVAYPTGIIFGSNGQVADENALQYEFVNLSNVPVVINGVFLDRYYTGSPTSPTIIAGAFNRWAPLMKSGERDTTLYIFNFQDTYYPAITPNHRLMVMKKLYYPLPVNRNPNRNKR